MSLRYEQAHTAMTVRVSRVTQQQLHEAAQARQITLGSLVRLALEQWLREQREPGA